MNELLSVRIERKSGMPLYLQLKHYIEHLVRTGRLLPGTRLEPERVLAEKLQVSRNTVSLAYRQLEKEGWVRSCQGQGTFVGDFSVDVRLNNGELRLNELIELGLQEAVAFGYSAEDFLEMVRERVDYEARQLESVQVAIVECNREQLDYFARELQLGSGVAVCPVLLDDVIRVPEHAQKVLSGADLVVTTFFHLKELEPLLPDSITVLGIALDPLLETVVRIARLPRRTKVGLVCLSTAFTERVLKSIENAGISELDLEVTTTRNNQELQQFLNRQAVIIVSPGRKREVESLWADADAVIEFVYRPDVGSINALKSAVLEARKKLQQRSDHHVAGW